MKVGDLVRLNHRSTGVTKTVRLGIVVERHNRVVPTAVVQWNGLTSTMGHRIDMLEVVSEGR